MNVFGMHGGSDGCTHYRIATPLWALEKRGHGVGWQPDLPPSVVRDADVIIGQRVCRPEISETWQQMAAAGKPLVFELDDDLFRVHPTNATAHKVYSPPDVQARLRENIAAATAVFTSTEPLAGVLREYNPRVYVLPNCVQQALVDEPRTQHGRDGLVVGWAGSQTHVIDFQVLIGQLNTFLARDTQTRVHAIGVNYFRASGVAPWRIRLTKWIPDLYRYYQAIDFDIGLIPLADDPFNSAKSDIKFLEYAALGIPTIASNVGPYAASIEHGKTGLLVQRPQDWSRYLRMLVNDGDMRREIGENARAWARTRTIEANVWQWEKALNEVIAS